jgi:light-regulated signal transduction histidine kinase (bacteriophytochrome)
MTTPPPSSNLDGCASEPIHIPGAIQPHGALLVLDEAELTCLQASLNAADFLGVPFGNAPGARLTELLPEAAGVIAEALEGRMPRSPVAVQIGGRRFDVSLKRTEAGVIAELETVGADASAFHQQLQTALAGLREAADLDAQHELAVRFIAELTGFERVMMYRFGEDWHGQVVAEHLSAPVDSYMGLHFPATDIPEQARELYRKSWLRIIPDSSYTPARIEPTLNPKTGRPLDMSFASLRSVSPIHLEYLRNMNVAASMSISLIVNGRLWGLIACHHRTPRVLPFAVRAVCEIFGQVASFEIRAKEEARLLSQYVHATEIQSQFFNVISEASNVIEALVTYTPQLLEFMDATGAAIYVNGQLSLVGGTPEEAQVFALVDWLKTQDLNPLLATEALSTAWPEAAAYQEKVSGLLAVRLSRVEPHFVMWFRPEVVTTVTWAGQPEKPLDEHQRLSPRKSFAAWQQTVTGYSRPWGPAERRGAGELVLAINALVLRRTETLLSENTDLERKNTDLNSFAYIASHDLREPLRGLENYIKFMREDHAEELSTEALRKLETMGSLVSLSKELIDVLNYYSHVGRLEVAPRAVNVDTLLDQVLASLEGRIKEVGLSIRRPARLPVVTCDPVLVREIFSNLLTNALKYNVSDEKWIEITCDVQRDKPTVFHFRDNGIGIREKHFEDIFRMFRRLHAVNEYGGGTGAGLAIVKTVVERHGGAVWVESVYGQGTTFSFHLGR